MNNVETTIEQTAQPVVTVASAQNALKLAKRKLEDAEIEAAAGLITADELEEARLRVKQMTAAVGKAELAEKRAAEARVDELKKKRFDAAAERAKSVRIEAIDMLTDDLVLGRDIARNLANQMVRQLSYLEGRWRGLRIRASAVVGQERAYDVRAVTGEGMEEGNNVLNIMNTVEAQIHEVEALAIAAEKKFWALQDEAYKNGQLTETQLQPCYYNSTGGDNFLGALEYARRDADRRYEQRQAERQKQRDAIASSLPAIDAELAVG